MPAGTASGSTDFPEGVWYDIPSGSVMPLPEPLRAFGTRGEAAADIGSGIFSAALLLAAAALALRRHAGLWPLAAVGLTLLRLALMRREEKAVAFPRGKG